MSPPGPIFLVAGTSALSITGSSKNNEAATTTVRVPHESEFLGQIVVVIGDRAAWARNGAKSMR